MKKLLLSSLVTTSIFAFAYTDTDISTASFLANQGIIVNQSTASNYRLDNTITRAEAIGIALKIKWVTLPESYTCKKYFSDTITNDWKCRAIELAADNGIITRNNTKARPNDTITRAEALGIVIRAGRINFDAQSYCNQKAIPDSDFGCNGLVLWDLSANLWQIHTFITYYVKVLNMSLSELSGNIQLRSNDKATRAEVFVFARHIFQYKITMSGEVTTL